MERTLSTTHGPAAAVPATAADLAVLDDPLEQQRFTRWSTDGGGRRIAESTLRLSGMYCAACAGIIEQALGGVDGVQRATVSAAGQRAAVHWDPQRTRPSLLVEAVRRAGYDAAPDVAAPARELRRAEGRRALWRLFVAAFCMMQVMMLATPSYVAGPGELAPDLAQLLNWGSWVLSLPVLLFSAGPFFAGLWGSLRSRRIAMDVPVAIGIAVTFVVSSGATFAPGGVFGHEVYFDSMTMFVTFLLGARFLELLARQRAAQALEGALDSLPQFATRVRSDGRSEQVSALRLAPGDRVRVALGQAIPADGHLLEGAAQVDEALLSGESAPVPKAAGDTLVAGSLNRGAPLLMRVERVGADTRHEAIVALMRSAMSQRPALARIADRLAAPFLWGVLGLAGLAFAVWSVLDPSRAVWVAVSVLIVTCPCALALAVPATLVAAAGGLARRGVLVQRLDALESMARLDRLFIDKTGTLTTQSLQLQQLRVWRANRALGSNDAALGVAASLAAWSRHPLSEALAAAAQQPAPWRWTQLDETPGKGLAGRDGQDLAWRLGSFEWARAVAADGGTACDAAAAAAAMPDAAAQVWLCAADGGCASFAFDEALREGAAEAIGALRALGCKLSLLSGDAAARTNRLARQLGFDEAIGAATPQGKLQRLAAAQQLGERVAMVGDGVNDAPVLARADASLAMGQGALVARAQADAVLAGNRPMDVVHTLRSARRAMRIVRQNLAWALVYNAACVPLALFGYLPPWAAGLGMAGSSTAVILNALRAAR
ncbi:MAG TPA: cation-translocating P-type ATPase [Rubrivivax sp.]|nr:cation-translocating P-type ATPase [Rubrivivax sp.]HPO19848.1 cation-translocating P-type ATPase [Rubrivivax sp.]